MDLWLLISLTFLIIIPANSFNLDARNFLEIKEKENQYFGYSVGFRKSLNQFKILVGSPKANDTREKITTGALYECNITAPHNCRRVPHFVPTKPNYSIKNQWLGVALDINPYNSQIIVCAHRFLEYADSQKMLMGACYKMNDTTTSNTTLIESIKGYFNPMYGISCRYSQTGKLVTGIPGLDQGKGGYVAKDQLLSNNGYDLYEGYTVTFWDDTPVIGKPRYREYGAVLMRNELILPPQTKYSFGSYFGSAIAIADLNYDGYKDLVIGAPFYSETFVEEGRVYIYFYDSFEGMFSDKAGIVLMEPSYRAQFGKSLATGDFNSDNYEDVIVGAPYENDGAGCIYVYNGKYKGIESTYSQKISGKELRDGLKTFGISFTRANDLDRNGYPDIGVGAYMSDSAYIFKARPTYVLTASLVASERILDMAPNCILNDRRVLCVNLTVKLNIGIKENMVYDLHLITDSLKTPEEKRTYFKGNGRQSEITESVTVRSGYFEKVYQIFIRSTMDILSPINFTLHCSLKDRGYSKQCMPLCPISNNITISEMIKFNTECGPDEICKTRLKVNLETLPPNITLGKDKRLTAVINVFNIGEHAYNARTRIFFSHLMDFESIRKPVNSSVECTSVNRMELSCFLGNPLRENINSSFVVTFLLGLTANVTKTFIAVNASTESQVERRYLMNTVNLTIKVYQEFDLELVAMSIPSTLAFRGDASPMTAMHTYQLRNNGPSNALKLIFSLDIPNVVINNSPLMAIKKYRVFDKNANPLLPASNESVCHLNTVENTGIDIKTDIKSILKYKNIANCSWLKCHRIVCEISSLTIFNIKVFELTLDIDAKLLKDFQSKLRMFDVVTNGTLRHTVSKQVINVHHEHANATTLFLISRLQKKIQWWIVICSILVGLLFLILVGVLLWKFGFFRRNRVSAADRRSLKLMTSKREPPQNDSQEES